MKTAAQIAEAAGVSEKTIKQAKAVQTKAAPEVVKIESFSTTTEKI